MNIETFPNPSPDSTYVIQHIAEEFTSVCPKTGHPDFGTIVLTYVPSAHCVELKAFKLFLQDYRNKGIFYEAVTNELFETFQALLKPKWMRLETLWNPHGGIRSNLLRETLPGQLTPPPYFGFSE